jgi:hypothetical protein
MSEDYDPDDNSGWYFPIFVFWLWMTLWKWPIGVVMIVTPLVNWLARECWGAYTKTEAYRYRQARRDIKRLISWGRRQIRKLSR